MSKSDLSHREEIEIIEEHWVNTLSGELPVTMLPTYPPTGETGQNRETRGQIRIPVPGDIVQQLNRKNNQSPMTTYMFWLAALNAVLYRYTALNEFLTGTTFFKTEQSYEGDHLMFIQGSISGDFSFSKLLDSIRRYALNAYKFQGFDFDRVYDQIKLKTGVAEPDIFQVAFISEKIQDVTANLDKFDFVMQLNENQEELLFQYCMRFYYKNTIESFAANLFTFMEHALKNPELQIDTIPLISQKELKKLHRFNRTEKDFPRHLMFRNIFEQQVEKFPHRIAVMREHVQVSYKQLNLYANQVAHLLRENGIKPNDLVAILCERSIKMLTSILGIFKAGGAYVPVDINYPKERILTFITQSGATVLLTSTRVLERIHVFIDDIYDKTAINHIVCMDKQDCGDPKVYSNVTTLEKLATYPTHNPKPVNQPGDVSYVMFTSASQGKPKGVMLENIGMMNHLHAKLDYLDVDENSFVAQTAPHCFNISVWQFLIALLRGGKTVIIPNETVSNSLPFAKHLIQRKISVLEVVPSFLNAFLDDLEYVIKKTPSMQFPFKLKNLLCTDESLKFNLIVRWFGIFPNIPVTNAYGPTEASDDVSHHLITKVPDRAKVPIGKALQNIHLYIVSEEMELCPIGVKGEICVSGISVGRGYLNNPEKTMTKFLEDPFSRERGRRLYKTGDVGRYLPDGTIEFKGRKDRQVKIKGFRVELGEIESKLAMHPAIKEVIVVGNEDLLGKKFLCAYFVPVEVPDTAEFKVFLARSLPDYMIPTHYIRMEKLPQLPDGKVNRTDLPSPGHSVNSYTPVAQPRDEIEKKLLEIWISVLGTEHITLDDDFFASGGSSLKATQMIHKIQKDMDVIIPLHVSYSSPTIHTLAKYIRKHRKEINDNTDYLIPNAHNANHYALSLAQEKFYTLSNLKSIGTTCNMPVFFQVEGIINPSRFREVVEQLIQRHEILRTHFPLENGRPMQCIHHQFQYDPFVYNITEAELPKLMKSFIKPFHLEKSVLFRIALAQTPERSILMTDFHQIIFDEASTIIFAEDLKALYMGDILPDLRVQYKDFSVRQRHRSIAKKREQQKQFWLQQFQDSIPEAKLPFDFPMPEQRSFKAASTDWKPTYQQMEKMRHLAAQNSATLHMVITTFIYILLARYTVEKDITIGIQESGRHHHDLAGILGPFTNTLAMRNFPHPEKNFLQFLGEVKQSALLTYEHRDYSFDRLVRELGLTWGAPRNPLLDTMLILEHSRQRPPKGHYFTLTRIPYDTKTTRYPLTIRYKDNLEELQFNWQYSTSLFKEKTIKQMAKNLSHMIDCIPFAEETTLKDIGKCITV